MEFSKGFNHDSKLYESDEVLSLCDLSMEDWDTTDSALEEYQNSSCSTSHLQEDDLFEFRGSGFEASTPEDHSEGILFFGKRISTNEHFSARGSDKSGVLKGSIAHRFTPVSIRKLLPRFEPVTMKSKSTPSSPYKDVKSTISRSKYISCNSHQMMNPMKSNYKPSNWQMLVFGLQRFSVPRKMELADIKKRQRSKRHGDDTPIPAFHGDESKRSSRFSGLIRSLSCRGDVTVLEM